MRALPDRISNHQILAECLAAACCKIFPGAQLIEARGTMNGLYCDFVMDQVLNEEILAMLEREVLTLVKSGPEIHFIEMMRDNAGDFFHHHQQSCLAEAVHTAPSNIVNLVKIGEYHNWLKRPLSENYTLMPFIKLTHFTRENWGDGEKTRVYACAAASKGKLKDQLKSQAEAKKRDHRLLGKQMGIYQQEQEGLFWLPNGGTLCRNLTRWWEEALEERGFQPVITPDADAPGHAQLFHLRRHSYRELPIKYAELNKEDRCTLFCNDLELEPNLTSLLQFILETAKIFSLKCEWVVYSSSHKKGGQPPNATYQKKGIFTGEQIRDERRSQPQEGLGEERSEEDAPCKKMIFSDRSQSGVLKLKSALDNCQLSYSEQEETEQFFGPALVAHWVDALGNYWKGPLIELDLVHPKRFGLTTHGKDDQRHLPWMVHFSLFRSLEHFVSLLIEHTGGEFPFWLAPEQLRVLPVGEKLVDEATSLVEHLRSLGFRVSVDTKNGSLGARIVRAEQEFVSYTVIIGDKEKKKGYLTVRANQRGKTSRELTKELLVEEMKQLLSNRILKLAHQ